MNTFPSKSLPVQIYEAIDQGDLDEIERLIRSNPDHLHFMQPITSQTWLGYAAGYASLAVVQKLLALGFDVNEGSERSGCKPLTSACECNHLDNAVCLLEAGSVMDTATSLQNPLFAAIVGRSPEIVRLLLEHGMDATVRYNSKTMDNMDAVAFALMQGEAECARVIALWNAKGDEAAAKQALDEADQIAEDNAYGKRKRKR